MGFWGVGRFPVDVSPPEYFPTDIPPDVSPPEHFLLDIHPNPLY